MATRAGERRLLVVLRKILQVSSPSLYISHAQLVMEKHMAFGFRDALVTLAPLLCKCYSSSVACAGLFCLHLGYIQGTS